MYPPSTATSLHARCRNRVQLIPPAARRSTVNVTAPDRLRSQISKPIAQKNEPRMDAIIGLFRRSERGSLRCARNKDFIKSRRLLVDNRTAQLCEGCR